MATKKSIDERIKELQAKKERAEKRAALAKQIADAKKQLKGLR